MIVAVIWIGNQLFTSPLMGYRVQSMAQVLFGIEMAVGLADSVLFLNIDKRSIPGPTWPFQFPGVHRVGTAGLPFAIGSRLRFISAKTRNMYAILMSLP